MGRTVIFLLSLAASLPCMAQNQAPPSSALKSTPPAPLYRITFELGKPITVVSDSRKVTTPYECTSDGTAFVNMLLQPSIYSPPVEVLVTIPSFGRFRIGNDTPETDVACVHDAKFLSFAHGEGRLVPLIGTAEPTPDPASVPQLESR